MVLVHLPVIPSERDGTVVSPSEDGLHRWGTRRDCKGDMEYSPNILRNSPTGCIYDIRGIEPLVQDMVLEQPVSSSVIQSHGAVHNTSSNDGGNVAGMFRGTKTVSSRASIAALSLDVCRTC